MKILLTGDSWATGDWNTDPFSTILKDLLVADGHEVMHRHYPACSDIPSLCDVEKHNSSVDCIIFFKTQVARLIHDYYLKKFKDSNESFSKTAEDFHLLFLRSIKEKKNLLDTFDILNQEIYSRLYKFNKKIILIGGVEKIKTKNYNFLYVIDDLVYFLTQFDNKNYTMILDSFMAIYKVILSSPVELEIKNNLLKDLTNFYDDMILFFEVLNKNKDFFGPNDRGHPNATAINLYYNKLIKPILEEIKNDNRTAI